MSGKPLFVRPEEAYKNRAWRLAMILKEYDRIADEFIAKVDSGKAHSVRTYAALKAVREKSKEVQSAAQ